MGSYEATLIAGQTLEFTIPAPCYRFQRSRASWHLSKRRRLRITGDQVQQPVPSTGCRKRLTPAHRFVLLVIRGSRYLCVALFQALPDLRW